MPRVKGVPNRKTAELAALAEKLEVDPFHILLLYAKGDWKALGYKTEMYTASEGEKSTAYKYHIDPAVRAKAAAEACQYLYPKRKAVEISSDPENPVVFDGKIDFIDLINKARGTPK